MPGPREIHGDTHIETAGICTHTDTHVCTHVLRVVLWAGPPRDSPSPALLRLVPWGSIFGGGCQVLEREDFGEGGGSTAVSEQGAQPRA